MSRIFSIALMMALGAGGAEAAVNGSPPAKQALVYRVRHSTYGYLGAYTNTIARNGDAVTVATEGKLSFSVLGISLFSQNISRLETWRGNRIVGFHGVTARNGISVEISGMAEGDSFVMTTPEGKTAAPADVRIANPWSRAAIEGTAMLTPDRGRLESVMLAELAPETLTIGGKKIRTEHFQVQRGGPRRYEIWLDETGTPVQFALVGPENTITFTLEG